MDPGYKQPKVDVIEVIDEFYSAILAQETLRGMIENARKGYRNGSFPIYGYKNIRVFDDRGNPKTKYEINEAEAKVVRLIFKLYSNGNGLKNIVMDLIRRDINIWLPGLGGVDNSL